MEKHGTRAVKGTVKRKPATLETITKRRRTIARNLATGATTTKKPISRCKDKQPTSDWAQLGAALSQSLNGTALKLRLMPPDGNCFYHAVAYRLGTLGHHYTPLELKAIAGANHGDEAEERHIHMLASKPVPLLLRFVPVNTAIRPLALEWGAALDVGCPASPQLTLVRWTTNGEGKHFDILEFNRPTIPGAHTTDSRSGLLGTSVNANGSTSTSTTKACPNRRGTKRTLAPPPYTRKLFKLIDGKVVRIRDCPSGCDTSLPPCSEAHSSDRPC